MTHQELLQFAEQEFKICLETLDAKNSDYSDPDDALKNIRAIEAVNVPTHTALLARIFDKVMRVGNLMVRPAAVVKEGLKDTLRDIIGYCILFLAHLDDKN